MTSEIVKRHPTIKRKLIESLTPAWNRGVTHVHLVRLSIRGLWVQHICYPTRTRSTGPLPVPVPDPYSKLLPAPTRTRGYTRTRHCQAFICIVYVPTKLIHCVCFQLGM